MNSEFTFWSTAFNHTEPQQYFINDCCFGDDVCKWLIESLRAKGFETDDEPTQEDFGWFFRFVAAGETHIVTIGFQPNDEATGNCWLGWMEKVIGFWAYHLKKKTRVPDQKAVDAINEVLLADSRITHLQWFEKGGAP